MNKGYYRFPTIHRDEIVFVCEDDLWSVPAGGGTARRLTSNPGEISRPWFSPDGKHLVFIGRDEGQPEIYLMPTPGGPVSRLTFMGASLCLTCGWDPQGRIVFASNAKHWYLRFTHLFSLALDGSPPEQLKLGLARAVSFGPGNARVIGRNTDDPARWKRYRGGTAGQIWIDRDGEGIFEPLLSLKSNLASPLWLYSSDSAGRIYFISDHEGTGNLYSVSPSGDDLQRHSHQKEFFVRNASSDGQRIVYQAGADLFVYDPRSGTTQAVEIELNSSRTQRSRKYVEAARYLRDWNLQPNGQSVVLTSRGKLFSMANWEGAVNQYGNSTGLEALLEPGPGVRYRLPQWLSDGKRLIAVTDEGGEEQFVIISSEPPTPANLLPGLDIGRPERIAVNPCKDQILFTNHRYELIFLDLVTQELRLIDRGQTEPIRGFAWSPDGEWAVFSVSVSLQTQALKLWQASTGVTTALTRPVLKDINPAFDPKGRYIYFISYRSFDPVYDNLHFDLGFPMGMRPYLITLRKDLLSPFIPRPPQEETEEAKPAPDNGSLPEGAEKDETNSPEAPAAEQTPLATKKPVQIDLDGIQDRLIAFPAPDGIYGRILGLANGKVIYLRFPLQSALDSDGFDDGGQRGSIYSYNFDDQKEELLVSGVHDFSLSLDGKWLIYRTGQRLRVLKAGEKPPEENGSPSRKTGWLDLERVKVSVLPGVEWRQMFREAWRLQRDQFWTPDMSKVDWLAVHDRYLPLVDRISSRAEFSDLMWEMQGELGTSHAYEFGGDYRPEPHYQQGFLGAEFSYNPEQDAWQIVQIHHGDSWDPRAESPLYQPGINIQPGDVLLSVNGQRLSKTYPPAAALVNLAGNEVALTVQSGAASASEAGQPADRMTRTVTVKTLGSEAALRYREWVEQNREYVHQASHGQAGYVHIPDMMGAGYAEFHRGYLAEVDHPALIIDVRFNRGGHVSALLLEKLARRRVGYDQSRWAKLPFPYPPDSVGGPMVAVTNEFAGSDGDIFSHGFKLMKLGLLIGVRTWGGVIGINPSHSLVDGTITTQPEFSFWFKDIGFGVENYGTDPDIEVQITPQDYTAGYDPQLERAVQEILRSLSENPLSIPDFSARPDRSQPILPG